MADNLFCMQCQRPLDERQLRMKSLTVESCPFCGTMVRQTEGMRATNLDAIIMEDVAAIDAWLDSHASATGQAVSKTRAENRNYEWSVTVSAPWGCEILYSADQTSIVAVRLVSMENGGAICEERQTLQNISARHGLQPHGSRQTDGLSGAVVCKWGVVRYLSTSTLSEELFRCVMEQLAEAMRAVASAFSGATDPLP